MVKFAEYDSSRDSFYHFSDTPNLYITPETVYSVFKVIGMPNTPEDRDIMDFIQKTEKLKMQYCLGKISLEEKKSQCLKLDDEFCAKHSFWAYVCDYYKKFYAVLGYGE